MPGAVFVKSRYMSARNCESIDVRKVLFICYFPPHGGMGSIRLARFARYLPEFGWQARVLSIKTGMVHLPLDEGLLDSVPRDTVISRVAPFDLTALEQQAGRFFGGRAAVRGLRRVLRQFPPDGELGATWLLPVYSEARRILAGEHIDALLTSSFPCIAHVIGYLLKKRTGIPWVADFRDEWSAHQHRQAHAGWYKRADRCLEQRVVRSADHIIAATEAYSAQFAEWLPPGERAGKVTTITNAFDQEDLSGSRVGLPQPFTKSDAVSAPRKFTIVYTGMLYGGLGFLTALESLLTDGTLARENIDFILAGQVYPLWQFGGETLLQKVSALNGVMRCVGWMPHHMVRQYVQRADVLLLVLDSNRGEATIPGKAFEYMVSGKTVLALVPTAGVTADLIRHTRTGVVIDPENVLAVREAILDLYHKWKAGNLHLDQDWTEICKHDAKLLTGRLAVVLDQVSNKQPRACS